MLNQNTTSDDTILGNVSTYKTSNGIDTITEIIPIQNQTTTAKPNEFSSNSNNSLAVTENSSTMDSSLSNIKESMKQNFVTYFEELNT